MKRWWKESVVYQIYPRSFKDSNGDGIGDLRGIIEKIDYLADLGITMVWLNPIFSSPNDDMGYDISDYKNIMKEFGTMEDFEELLAKFHEKSIKVILDLVINHSSDEHQWFCESRTSKDNLYRDYYIWREGNGKEPPTNWGSEFGGSAWKLDDRTGEYYLHLYSEKQPDLNWENQKLREEIYDMMRYWLDKGIDGFRMDVINKLAKDQNYPNGIIEEGAKHASFRPFSVNIPKVHDYLREMNKTVLADYDIVTVGETSGVTPQIADLYVRADRQELNMLFQFEHMFIDRYPNKWKKKAWKLTDLKRVLNRWQTELHPDSWNSLYWSNHDQPRAVSRFGNDTAFREESGKMLAMLIHMMRGTPFIYQGEEIGMTNVSYENLEDYKDIEIHNLYKEEVLTGRVTEKEFRKAIDFAGRDNARSPMQWDDTKNAGFSKGEPWIKVNNNYRQINVKNARADENSIYNFYKQLIQLRKTYDVIVYGDFQCLNLEDERVYAYKRQLKDEILLVVANFTEEEIDFELEDIANIHSGKLLLSNYPQVDETFKSTMHLKSYEARTYKIIL